VQQVACPACLIARRHIGKESLIARCCLCDATKRVPTSVAGAFRLGTTVSHSQHGGLRMVYESGLITRSDHLWRIRMRLEHIAMLKGAAKTDLTTAAAVIKAEMGQRIPSDWK
jgi:hypothetical protein